MGRATLDFEIANNRDVELAEGGIIAPDQIRRLTLRGVVDAGATRLVLPESAIKPLGLTPSGMANVHHADRRSARIATVRGVWLELLGRQGVFTAFVEPNRTNALIGAIVMEDLDFLVDCVTQTLIPRDPGGLSGEIE